MKKVRNISSNLSIVASAIALSLIFTGCGESDPKNEGNHLPDVHILQNNKTVNVGTKVNLTSTAIDVDGDALTYEWKFVSKPTSSSATLTTSTTKKASFTADKAGKYVVQFVAKDVVDAIGKDTVTITAKASNSCTSYTELSEDITNNKTLDGCYKIMKRLSVSNDALLTVKPGSTILFNGGAGLNIYGGALKSVGTPKEPILFTGEQKVSGYWEGITFENSNNPNNEIGYTTIEYAGGNGRAALSVFPDGNEELCRLKLYNTTLKHSSSYGFYFSHNAILDRFENVTSTKNEKTAGFIHITNADKLDSQSDFSGNLGDDYVTVGTSGGWINNDKTWKALTVPYNILGNFSIDADATLTIKAGATIVFDRSKTITTYGGLKAIGTAKSPIVFTGKGETPGYWSGLKYFRTNNADNVLDYVTIEYGGEYYGGLVIDSTDASSYTRISVTNSTFKDNAGAGIYIRYDEYAKYNKDIDSSNTFINNESGAVVRGD